MRRHYVTAFAVVLAIFSGSLAASAQTITTAAAPGQVNMVVNSNPLTNLPMQKLGPEDLMSLSVYDSPEFSLSVRVAADGTIRLPMLKSTIKVQGLFPNEAEVAIADELKRENLLVDPFVTVTVAEYHSRPVNVSGAVRNPVIFQAIGSVTLLDAISRAGGINTDAAGPNIVVTRPNGAGQPDSVQRIAIKQLMDGADPSLNVKLTGGEDVRVPDVGKIIVEGNVVHPGVFPVLDPIAINTVTSAIAQAQGLAQYADHKAYIYRTDEQGVRHTIDVPLWDIINRKKPDMVLQAKDILHIPDSPRRRITQTAIQTATGVGASATNTAILIAH